jgi:hypothetical protein
MSYWAPIESQDTSGRSTALSLSPGLDRVATLPPLPSASLAPASLKIPALHLDAVDVPVGNVEIALT